jgi:hypothetical protein
MIFTAPAMKTAVAAVGIAAGSVFAAPITSAAPPNVQGFGASEQLVNGPLVTSYMVSNLQPTDTAIPGFAPQGKLYEANVTATANNGTVTPLISGFNARAADGQTYRIINTVPAPDGIPPAPLNQGQQSSGKIYFDVTGQPPDGVVYNDGVQDVLIWTSNA